MPDMDTMLAELIRYNSRPTIAEGEFFIQEYRDRWEAEHGESIPEGTARCHLAKMVEEGLLTSRKVFHDGYFRRAYSFSEEE